MAAAIVTTPTVVSISSVATPSVSTVTNRAVAFVTAPASTPTVVTGVRQLAVRPPYRRWTGTAWVTFTP